MMRLAAAAMLAAAFGCLHACGSNTNTGAVSQAETAPNALSGVAVLAAACSGCHAADNTAITPFDSLTAEAIKSAMLNYQSDTTGTTVMHRLARGYSDAQIAEIATYLASRHD